MGDWVDGLGNGVEGVVDSAQTGVGEAVNWGADRAADGLSAVGAGGLAEGVRDFGEGVNNRLGGDVAERELGESEDPKELIHGSPEALESRARHLRDFFRAFDSVGQGLRSLDSGGWQGEAGDAFRAKYGVRCGGRPRGRRRELPAGVSVPGCGTSPGSCGARPSAATPSTWPPAAWPSHRPM
ncbi:WXG100 family type VII secretion target [Streptomyces bluensis]|uniref:WXG100 family type VII secretion target n=1 Tax=Streptomyces bluensis TaxID=33897 RepID=A0ABW6ULX4_9ACTN